MTQPLEINWGARTAWSRGPIVTKGTDRNAIGVHVGGYALFRGLSVATGELRPRHIPDYSGTQPAVTIGPFPQWSDPGKIVTFDPWGHRVAQDFRAEIAAGRGLQPSIAITTGQLTIPEIATAVALGTLRSDGTILHTNADVTATKIAIEPVWFLPGIAARLKIDEHEMRQQMVAQTGGMYPELVTRPDMKVFLPPIGGISVYIFGNPALLGNRATAVTCRIHDECNGSDVFGSDLCTCRPYLIQGIEQSIRGAQQGGVGVVIYNRKEGRALGEVVKYLVYNARRRNSAGDRAEEYFAHTKAIAGTQDLRMQSLSTDVLHWLGIRRIATWVSMSNIKSDAVRQSGIAIEDQMMLSPDSISENAQVEIGAKVASGYFNRRA